MCENVKENSTYYRTQMYIEKIVFIISDESVF